MFWGVANLPFGGPIINRFGDEYHLFSTVLDVAEKDQRKRTIFHAVSRDMVSWQRLPDALGVGPEGAFDGHTLYDIFAMEAGGTYYMHYTGIDRPMGPGQKQAIGVALSRDLIHWERHPANPVLRADPHFYEQAIPREATYQEKDFDRLWFRDPWISRDAATGHYYMLIGARDAHAHPDVRGCIACATSDDLIRWTPRPPLYSPRTFHTMECPCHFEHDGLHYLTWLSHHDWGAPFLSGDPYQTTGNFYAISRNGIGGPYEMPEDSVAMAGAFVRADGATRVRAGGLKMVAGPDGRPRAYYAFNALPAVDDEGAGLMSAVSAPKRVMFFADGRMAVAWDPETASHYGRTVRVPDAGADRGALPAAWRAQDGALWGKNLLRRSALLFGESEEKGIVSTRITFVRGERAGLLLRCAAEDGPGWQVVLDRRWQRVEFGLAGRPGFIEARRWTPSGATVELKVALWGASIEVYVDDRLMLHQVRYREKSGRTGLVVEKAEARFA